MQYGQKCSQEPMSTDGTWNLEVWGQLKDLILKCPKLQIRSSASHQELTFTESVSIIHESLADSVTYVVFWDRCCSLFTHCRLWEVQDFVQSNTACNVWQSHVSSHTFSMAFPLHLASWWIFLPILCRCICFPLGCFLKKRDTISVSYVP